MSLSPNVLVAESSMLSITTSQASATIFANSYNLFWPYDGLLVILLDYFGYCMVTFFLVLLSVSFLETQGSTLVFQETRQTWADVAW